MYLIYLLPIGFIWTIFFWRARAGSRQASEIRDTNKDLGLDQPASLHPVTDPNICIGCGACVRACPEQNVLGLIHGKVELISPANCIGHGACQRACPLDGITLVFGTAKRGMDIPKLSEAFETTVPGIFIAGELGGMGLIRNAIEQGKQAVEYIDQSLSNRNQSEWDLVIVGAGPAGIAAALTAKSLGLKYLMLEQSTLGGTVAHFPRKKLVMTAPANLPLVGKMNFREVAKERLIEYWQNIMNTHKLNLQCEEQVADIQKQMTKNEYEFTVQTNKARYQSARILLCLGRRGTPRKLEVPGEEHQKVVYHLVDPRQYQGQSVLVVGGGDSALEAALAISEEDNTTVTLSYRSESFSRAKPKNRALIDEAQSAGRLNILFESQVASIEKESVCITSKQGDIVLQNDAVIVCVGGILPNGFLKHIGIDVETKYGTA